MLLLDATHTSHTRAQTGIQRVVRALHAELAAAEPVRAVCFDPHLQAWRALDAAELATLRDRSGTGKSRGATWSLTQRLAGRVRRLAGRRPAPPAAEALVCPELFSARVATHLPELFARVRGPRVALFHDAIALRYPELTPPATVARMPAYLRELAQFDGVAAISEDSARTLREFWQWLGLANPPPVQAIPLGLEPVPRAIAPAANGAAPRVLCVSTIEGRKNHRALLDAAEALWRAGGRFELELIGMPRADTGAAALARIRELQAAGRPLHYHGVVNEAALHAAYARAAFTVYPSLMEGFGLPVFESLQHGRPCVCLGHGALGETARGGGVRALAAVDAATLEQALRDLLGDPAALRALAAEAEARKFRSWKDYTRDLRAWMATLPRRT